MLLVALLVASAMSRLNADVIAGDELQALSGLAIQDVPMNEAGINAYLTQVAAVMNRVDSDAAVQDAFKRRLERAFGRRAPRPTATLQLRLVASSPDPSLWARISHSKTWEMITIFLQQAIATARDEFVPGSDFLNATDPAIAKTLLTVRTRTPILNKCLTNVSNCDAGLDPAYNALQKGDYRTALSYSAPELIPAPPKPPPMVWVGRWSGHYAGSLTNGCSIMGPMAVQISDASPDLLLTVTLTGSQRSGTCQAEGDESYSIRTAITGNSLAATDGSPTVSLSATGPNSATGSLSGPGGQVTFTLTR